MSDKKLLIKDKIIDSISDVYPVEGGSVNRIASARSIYDLEQELLSIIMEAGGNVIEALNGSIATALAEQLIIINNNINLLPAIQNIIDGRYVTLTSSVNSKESEVTTTENSLPELISKSTTSADNIQNITNALTAIEEIEFTDMIIGGTSDKFYPIWWLFEKDKSAKIIIKKEGSGTGVTGLYLEMIGVGGSDALGCPRSLFIKEFADKDGISAKLLSLNMYCYTSDPNTMSFSLPSASGLYLRGGATYKIYCSSDVVRPLINTCVGLGQSDLKSIIDNGTTYNMPSIPETTIVELLSDERLLYVNTINRYAPISLTPGDDALNIGGTIGVGQSDIKTKSIISTGASAVSAGITGDGFGCEHAAAVCNGPSGICKYIGGDTEEVSISNIRKFTIISTDGSQTTSTLQTQTKRIDGSSNGVNDVAIVAGGLNNNGDVELSDIQTGVISTDANFIKGGDLLTIASFITATSNGVNDVNIFSGGSTNNVSFSTIQQNIISTATSTTSTGALTSARVAHSSTSNTTSDIAIHFAGDTSLTTPSSVVEKSIISTGASATSSVGTLSVQTRNASSVSNGTNDAAITAGGWAVESANVAIQYRMISTDVACVVNGTLVAATANHASTSNA